jgi:hypothetical protein
MNMITETEVAKAGASQIAKADAIADAAAKHAKSVRSVKAKGLKATRVGWRAKTR